MDEVIPGHATDAATKRPDPFPGWFQSPCIIEAVANNLPIPIFHQLHQALQPGASFLFPPKFHSSMERLSSFETLFFHLECLS